MEIEKKRTGGWNKCDNIRAHPGFALTLINSVVLAVIFAIKRAQYTASTGSIPSKVTY